MLVERKNHHAAASPGPSAAKPHSDRLQLSQLELFELGGEIMHYHQLSLERRVLRVGGQTALHRDHVILVD